MSRRLQIVLPDPVAAKLSRLAASTREPPSTLAAQMVRDTVASAAMESSTPRPKPARPRVRSGRGKRPAWLEPVGGDPRWRGEMWGAVVELRARYPRALAALKEGWWTDGAQTETLCALAVWRAEIDEAGDDPREELAFHAQLADYARAWRQEGGGVTKAWKPGARPGEWGGASS